MRQATRPERRSCPDTHEMKGSLYALSRGLAKGSIGRLGQEDLLRSNVD